MKADIQAIISLVPEGAAHRVIGDRQIILSSLSVEIWTTRLIELTAWELRGLNDPFWRLYIPTHGRAMIATNDGLGRSGTELVAGRAYVIPPHTTIFSEIIGEGFGKWYLHFSLGQRGDRVMPGVFPVELTSVMHDSMRDLSNLEKRHYPWASLALVGEALRQLPETIWSLRKVDPRIEVAMHFISSNLSRKLTSQEVATAAGVSVRNLNHLFQQNLGKSPMNVLLDFRLNQACRLLRLSDASIDQIAEDCGFPNRYYFSRMMKQVRATSPAAYRKAEW